MKLRAIAVAMSPLLFLTGCGTGSAGADPAASRGGAPKTSVKPPAANPSYADVTRGDSSTAALLYTFDAEVRSAVLEPVLFMDGPAYCTKFRVKLSNAQCQREWVIVESHQKAAVPVSRQAKLYTASSDTEDCSGSMERGGTCLVTTAEFAKLMAQAGKNNFLVHVTITDGTIIRIAEEYRP